MSFIDVHAHLDRFSEEELDKVIKNAIDNNISTIIASGIDPNSNRKVLEISKKYDIVKASIGIYPPDAFETETNTKNNYDTDEELKFIEENKNNIVSIGEIGLDYATGSNKEQQIEVFKKQLELAKKLDLPVIIHSRKAEAEVLEILEKHEMKKVLIHCFCGKKSLIKKGAELGYFFSVPTNVVRAQNFQELVKMVNINQLLTETDTPYLSPFKDKQNEPAFVVESVKKIAEIKGFEVDEVENNIILNYKRLFE